MTSLSKANVIPYVITKITAETNILETMSVKADAEMIDDLPLLSAFLVHLAYYLFNCLRHSKDEQLVAHLEDRVI